MATSLRATFTKFALVGILVLATLSFMVQVQLDNGVTDGLDSVPFINNTIGNLTGNLTEQRDTVQNQKNAYDQEIPERGFGSLLIFSIVTVGQKFGSVIVGTYNLLVVVPSLYLGLPEPLIAVMTSILIVTILLLTWRVIRVGS